MGDPTSAGYSVTGSNIVGPAGKLKNKNKSNPSVNRRFDEGEAFGRKTAFESDFSAAQYIRNKIIGLPVDKIDVFASEVANSNAFPKLAKLIKNAENENPNKKVLIRITPRSLHNNEYGRTWDGLLEMFRKRAVEEGVDEEKLKELDELIKESQEWRSRISEEDHEIALLNAATAFSNVNPVGALSSLSKIVGSVKTNAGISFGKSLLSGISSEAIRYAIKMAREKNDSYTASVLGSILSNLTGIGNHAHPDGSNSHTEGFDISPDHIHGSEPSVNNFNGPGVKVEIVLADPNNPNDNGEVYDSFDYFTNTFDCGDGYYGSGHTSIEKSLNSTVQAVRGEAGVTTTARAIVNENERQEAIEEAFEERQERKDFNLKKRDEDLANVKRKKIEFINSNRDSKDISNLFVEEESIKNRSIDIA